MTQTRFNNSIEIDIGVDGMYGVKKLAIDAAGQATQEDRLKRSKQRM